MSWTPEVVIISGYKVSPKAWQKAFDKWEKLEDTPLEWEDLFLDTDPISNKDNAYFFGRVIYTIDEYADPIAASHILAPSGTIEEVRKAYAILFDGPVPQYQNWIVMRYV